MPHLSAPLTDKRYQASEGSVFLRWHNVASCDLWVYRLVGALCLVLKCMWLCPGGHDFSETGLIVHIYVKAPVWFNGLDIFKIDPTTEKASVRSNPSNTDAAQTMIGSNGGNKICGIVKSQTV